MTDVFWWMLVPWRSAEASSGEVLCVLREWLFV